MFVTNIRFLCVYIANRNFVAPSLIEKGLYYNRDLNEILHILLLLVIEIFSFEYLQK